MSFVEIPHHQRETVPTPLLVTKYGVTYIQKI